MNKKIKINCPECGKKIKILLRFGQTFMYDNTRKPCPYCGWRFGIISYSVA